MKRFIFTSLLWILLTIFFNFFGHQFVTESTYLQVWVFLLAMLVSTPLSTSLGNFFFPNKTHTIKTNLGPSGTITGPDFELPKRFRVNYESALRPPTITHYYDALDIYEGFVIDFGNGRIGIMHGKMSVTGSKSGLKLSVKSRGGIISVT